MMKPACSVSSCSLTRKRSSGLESAASIRTKVFVWGLNDKDQLGGLKGSKVSNMNLLSYCIDFGTVMFVGHDAY